MIRLLISGLENLVWFGGKERINDKETLYIVRC
jgi:hypothetical protein